MSEPPNVATSLLFIHQVITRAIEVALDGCAQFAESGFPDASAREGFGNYVRTLVTVLTAHSQTEDELAFPRMQERVPSAPYEAMEQEHLLITPLLAEVTAAVEVVEHSKDAYQPVKNLRNVLAQLRDVWYPHIRKEEENFSPEVLARLFSTEEHVHLISVLTEHSKKIAQPDFLVVPFMLFNLPPDEREQFSLGLPPVVTQQLVPVDWKDKWASMKPFLLD